MGAGAVAALALWPVFASHQTVGASFTPAPVLRDYESRDRYVSFFEGQIRRDPADQIQMRMLAQQYMQRFRERFDMGDVTRAEHLARRSIRLQPQGNTSAQMTLASAELSYHDFTGALTHEREAVAGEPFNMNARAQIASLLMERGQYAEAKRTLDSIPAGPSENPSVDSVRARYLELTGKLAQARELIATASRSIDSGADNPAYDRSWYHLRAGQLAFEAGDYAAAETEYASSLATYPHNAVALMWQARLYRAQKRWPEALAAATQSADLYPLPQTLGYRADAQRALGRASEAAQTDALIATEAKLFNVQGVNDRLLANYYAQRHIHLDDALRAARADYAKRGDEIYADDTMASVLEARGAWAASYRYAERAVRLGTKDSQVQYHAAIAALHVGRIGEARRRLRAALQTNAAFDAFDADDARAKLTERTP